jgi:hypothetical protein
MQAERGPCTKKDQSMDEQPSQEWIDQVNADFAACMIDHIQTTLTKFGIPRGTFSDDQFNNFVAMYNRRGDMITSLQEEIASLRGQVSNMQEVLVTVANWPNGEDHPQIQAMKVWASSVVDPSKVNTLKVLTSS